MEEGTCYQQRQICLADDPPDTDMAELWRQKEAKVVALHKDHLTADASIRGSIEALIDLAIKSEQLLRGAEKAYLVDSPQPFASVDTIAVLHTDYKTAYDLPHVKQDCSDVLREYMLPLVCPPV
jgi:hypothetical protein